MSNIHGALLHWAKTNGNREFTYDDGAGLTILDGQYTPDLKKVIADYEAWLPVEAENNRVNILNAARREKKKSLLHDYQIFELLNTDPENKAMKHVYQAAFKAVDDAKTIDEIDVIRIE